MAVVAGDDGARENGEDGDADELLGEAAGFAVDAGVPVGGPGVALEVERRRRGVEVDKAGGGDVLVRIAAYGEEGVEGWSARGAVGREVWSTG